MENRLDLRYNLLLTSKIGKLEQEKIDLQVTEGKWNFARIRNQLDLLYEFRFFKFKIFWKSFTEIGPNLIDGISF